ncbi:MAG TPA: hypothetical protein ENJ18_00465 [Nannocystis exedens]|nr:hypothetical protein [Nannocystis exedens]
MHGSGFPDRNHEYDHDHDDDLGLGADLLGCTSYPDLALRDGVHSGKLVGVPGVRSDRRWRQSAGGLGAWRSTGLHTWRRVRTRGVALLLLSGLVACTADMGDTDGSATTGATGSGSSTGESMPPPPEAQVNCELGPIVSGGRYFGTLREVPPGAGICGVEGMTTYLHVAPGLDVDLSLKVNATGFTPRLGISPDCAAAEELVCGEGPAVIELRDVSAGTLLTLAVGGAADDPGLMVPMPEPGEPDPLEFTVDVGMRRILGLGEPCLPESRGRCPTGSLCASPAGEDPADLATWVCDPLPGDTCASAELVDVDALSGEIIVDLASPQTDAHQHQCTGEGLRERVLRLAVHDLELPPAASLVIETKAKVGLAARAPGCAAEAEIACVALAEGVVLTIPDLQSLVLGGVDPFVFVEWEPSEGQAAEEPISLAWTILGE